MLIASVILSADRAKVTSLMGFKGTQVDPGNRGSQLLTLFSGVSFCALGTRALLRKLATGRSDVPLSDFVFLSYLQKVVDSADDLFTRGAVGSEQAELPKDIAALVRPDHEEFQRFVAQGRYMEAAGRFNPYVVGIWNHMLKADVDTTKIQGDEWILHTTRFFNGMQTRLRTQTP
jgi:hypothetical protein